MKNCIILVLIILVTACSTRQIIEQQASEVPLDRIYDKQYVNLETITSDDSAITIIRDSGFYGMACTHTMFLNNEKVFGIREGEYITLILSPGEYYLRLESGAGACLSVSLSQNAKIDVGEHEKYRISISSTSQINLSRIE